MAVSFFSKSFHPLRCHLLSDTTNKSFFRSWFENALGKTRQAFRDLYGRKDQLSPQIYRHQHRLPAEFFRKKKKIGTLAAVQKSNIAFYRPGLVHNVTAKWVSDSVSAAVTKEWRRKLLQRGTGLSFVGFALAKNSSLLTEEEEREGISYLIRDSFSLQPWQNVGLNIDKNRGINREFSLADLNIGDMIAKGSNAAVYSACFKEEVTDVKVENTAENECTRKQSVQNNIAVDEKNNSLLSYTKLIISHSEGEQGMELIKPGTAIAGQNTSCNFEKLEPYNLAVKIMFNYSAESNAFAIWNAMHKETLPAVAEICFDTMEKQRVRKQRLKPHPNVVEMYFCFADQVPLLPGAYKNYPQALPVRLLNDGCGRNMTLFLVMKRYHCSLMDYLKTYNPSTKTSLLLFTQLLEALAHLLQSNVAHRDLKSDNILIDLSQDVSSPKLVISDFGCCLEGLCLNYSSYEISKGGNMALMAPEVINIEAGPFSQIDYSRSDLWTAGTIAYEIFGGANPFYPPNRSFESGSYDENNLPSFPPTAPSAIQKLVKDLLRKDPKQRPKQSFAATVCQILLHAPPELLSDNMNKKISNETLDWMFAMSSKTFLESSLKSSSSHSVEFELRHSLCSRIQYLEVIDAFKYILDC